MSRLPLRWLVLAGALSLGACAVVPAGGYYEGTYYGGGYPVAASAVVVPPPAVVVQPVPVWRPWGGGYRHGFRPGYGRGGHWHGGR